MQLALRRTSGVPIFANGAVMGAFAYTMTHAIKKGIDGWRNRDRGGNRATLAQNENSPDVPTVDLELDSSTPYFSEASALNEADKMVAALSTDGNEWTVLTVEKDTLYYNTVPVSSGGANKISISDASIAGISMRGYRWVNAHHNHPTNPLISGPDVKLAKLLDFYNGFNGNIGPSAKVSINHGGRISWANQFSRAASHRNKIKANYTPKQARENTAYKGIRCRNYVCN